jgi:hypothetical protein
VTTFTSNKFSAGTDANIFITMKGPLGSVERRKLDHGPGESLFTNKFERNQADTFFFSGPKVRKQERWASKARGAVPLHCAELESVMFLRAGSFDVVAFGLESGHADHRHWVRAHTASCTETGCALRHASSVFKEAFSDLLRLSKASVRCSLE